MSRAEWHRDYYKKNRKRILARQAAARRRNPAHRQAQQLAAHRRRPFMQAMRSAKYRAAQKKIPFSLTKEWAEKRWTGCCEVTGIAFQPPKGLGGPEFFSPTIDRIDKKIGYVTGNCRFVLFAVNLLRWTGSDKDMFEVARAILEYEMK